MSARFLVAAAVPKGATVRFSDGLAERGPLTVAKVENGTPVAGLIRWTDTDDRVWTVTGAQPIEVVRLPDA